MCRSKCPDFSTTLHCRSRRHCHVCRRQPLWRSRNSAPEVCPHGVTLEDLPQVQLPKEKPIPAYIQERMAICKACESHYCPLHQANRATTPCHKRNRLARPLMCCPQNRWLPVAAGETEKEPQKC